MWGQKTSSYSSTPIDAKVHYTSEVEQQKQQYDTEKVRTFIFCPPGSGHPAPPSANIYRKLWEKQTLLELRCLFIIRQFSSPWEHTSKPSLQGIHVHGSLERRLSFTGSIIKSAITSDKLNNYATMVFVLMPLSYLWMLP